MEQYTFVEMHCYFAAYTLWGERNHKFHRTKLIKTAQGLILLLSKNTYIYLRVLSISANKLKWLSENKLKTTNMTKT